MTLKARHAIRLIPIICLLLAAAAAGAQDFYWETPRALAEGQGRFPSLLQVKDGLLALWQESDSTGTSASGDATGQAWISSARLEDGQWVLKRRFAGPYPFSGSEPLVYSAQAEGDAVAIASSSGDGRIEVQVSKDGGRSFVSANGRAPSSGAVAPRIFRSASGGWLLFVTQGSAETLNLSYSVSPDGLSWKDFQPFIDADENLSLNFLPSAAHLDAQGERRDVVVFQSLLASSRPTFQLYAKYSTDGGQTWTKARRITEFQDPVQRDRGGPDNFDNQRPWLQTVAGKLWLAWERRPLGSQPQIYTAPLTDLSGINAADVDMVSSGSGSCGAPEVFEEGKLPAVTWFDNRRGGNRIYLALRQGLDWSTADLSGGAAEASFGRVSTLAGRTYAIWQAASGGRDRVMLLAPDLTVSPPSLAAVDFTVGRRTRAEKATIRVDMPADSSGIEGWSWTWGRDPKAVPAHEVMAPPGRRTVEVTADADGPWYLSVSALDFAGNWSEPARIRFDRDRTPPPAPVVSAPALDDKGFLAASSFGLDWSVPAYPDGSPADDVAGYSWSLSFVRNLGREVQPVLPPGVVPKGALPPPAIMGASPRTSYVNVDDGYYVFTVEAIDATGNISPPTAILLASNKYIPYTIVNYADSSRDDFGRTTVRIVGRGFVAEGLADRVVIDRDAREPYDLETTLEAGGYRILSDREISGITFEGLEAGSYRIGIHHPKRGWYWTRAIIELDISGTLKFGGQAAPYKPSWVMLPPSSHNVSIYDIILASALVFSVLGLALAGRQALQAIRDAETVRLEVLALVRGGPMPTEVKARAARTLRRRGLGLRVKVTFTITVLVVFIVVLVSVPLGIFMTRSESSTLASGLQQRAYVLLESVAQGGRSYLPSQDLLQLGFLPQQAQAMDDAAYITVTGYGAESTTDPDVVWATNDPDILKKIDTKTLQPGVSRLKDGLSPNIATMMADINSRAAADVGSVSKALADLSQEGQSLATRLDAASQRRLAEIGTTSRAYENTISEKLFALANQSVGALPAFDPALAASRKGSYLFYKPILFRRGQDGLFFRGMVRLEVRTDKIVEAVQAERAKLYTTALAIAAVALGLGLAGAFLLSSIIVIPIKKLVKAIETIRDEDDKEKLAGMTIEVASRDELFTLADTVNQMTDGLAKAAKASKELIVGKGIQKMFIPLDASPGAKAKLSTGHHEEKDFEYFGYYEGAKGVSGDYWDFKSINPRYHYFIKCDISGKGVSAALIMVQVATMVINYFNEWKKAMPRTIDLTDLTYKINDFLEERKFVGRFAAFTLGVWDSHAGVAYLCEAGDRKLHVWDARKRELVEEILPDSPAAGPLPSFLVEMKQPFVQVTRKLEQDDVLLLYTDGIEEAKRHFRDASFKVVECTDAPKDQPHENHSGGQDNEEFGYDRLTEVLKAVDRRGSYRLERHHNPVKDEVLSFDFSACTGSLEEQVIALIAVEKVFRMYRDPTAGPKDIVLVDEKVDSFLERHFDQYRLFCTDKGPHQDPQNENPGYLEWRGIKEDDQYDDLTILGIRRK